MALYQADNPVGPNAPTHFDPATAEALISRYLESRRTHPDSEALDAALRACAPLVNSLVIFYADEFDREDVAQEVLLHLISALPTYDPSKGELKPWLSAVIRRRAISLWRMRHLREPEALLSLNDEVVAELPAHDPEPEAILPHVALLTRWLRLRFPSMPESLHPVLAETMIASLADGVSNKATVKGLRAIAEPPLTCNQVIAVHSAAIVFLRAVGWSPRYIEPPPEHALEYTLIPELFMLLGAETTHQLYTLFRGTTLHFRARS